MPNENRQPTGPTPQTRVVARYLNVLPRLCRLAGLTVGILLSLVSTALATSYEVTNLVSDIPGVAAYTDPNLVNPWGFAASSTSPFWVADNGTGVSTLYNGTGQPQALVVTIPPPAGGVPPSSPTGVVFNGGPGFEIVPGSPARFLFATEDGTISGWSSGTNAILKVDNSATADYKGLAVGSNGGGNFLYAANFAAGTIDVFDATFAQTFTGGFIDPVLPAGYAPFNIQNVGGELLVTYGQQDAGGHDAVAGAGNGIVDVFATDGSFVRRLLTGGALNSPWGLALAPAGFGEFSGDLLVGNFGDGQINAFDPASGAYQGALLDPMGLPVTIDGLWGLNFGNGGDGGDLSTLFFAAGIPGGGSVEDHGLFGSIAIVPEPSMLLPFVLILVGLRVAAGKRQRRI